jgi:hypothetical protein
MALDNDTRLDTRNDTTIPGVNLDGEVTTDGEDEAGFEHCYEHVSSAKAINYNAIPLEDATGANEHDPAGVEVNKGVDYQIVYADAVHVNAGVACEIEYENAAALILETNHVEPAGVDVPAGTDHQDVDLESDLDIQATNPPRVITEAVPVEPAPEEMPVNAEAVPVEPVPQESRKTLNYDLLMGVVTTPQVKIKDKAPSVIKKKVSTKIKVMIKLVDGGGGLADCANPTKRSSNKPVHMSKTAQPRKGKAASPRFGALNEQLRHRSVLEKLLKHTRKTSKVDLVSIGRLTWPPASHLFSILHRILVQVVPEIVVNTYLYSTANRTSLSTSGGSGKPSLS